MPICSYVCHLNENSGQGTTLVFTDGYVMQVHDDSTVWIFYIYLYIRFYTSWPYSDEQSDNTETKKKLILYTFLTIRLSRSLDFFNF